MRIALVVAPERLWYDEAFSVLVARLPLARLIVATVGDVHPPLYYLLLSVWLRITPFLPLEIAARLPSLILSLVALWLYWRLLPNLQITGGQARIAWLLAAYLPGLVHYASEARMYALLEVGVLGALLALLSSMRRFMRILFGGLACGVVALTHNTGLIYCAVIAVIVLLQRRSKIALGDVAGAGAIGAAMWLPWLPAFLHQLAATGKQYWIWHNGLSTMSYMAFQSIFYYRLTNWLSMPAMMLIGGLTVPAIIAEWRRPGIILLALGPAVLGIIASAVVSAGAILHRALMPTLFGYAALWSGMLLRRDVGRVLVALVVLVVGYADLTFITRGRDMAGYDALADIHAQPGDIIYSSNPAGLQLVPYTELPIYFAPTTNTIGEMLSAETQQAIGLHRAWLAEISWQRAWLVYAHLPLTNPAEDRYIAALVAHYHAEKVAEYGDQLTTKNTIWLLYNSPPSESP